MTQCDLPISTHLRSPKYAARIRARLETAEARTLQILKAERVLLLNMAAALRAYRRLNGDALAGWPVQIGESPELLAGAAGGIEQLRILGRRRNRQWAQSGHDLRFKPSD